MASTAASTAAVANSARPRLVCSTVPVRLKTGRKLGCARAYHSADLFAGVIVLGIIGLVSNLALQEIERYVLRWKRR